MILDIFKGNAPNPKRKLVSLSNPSLVERLVGDEALTRGWSDSSVIEDCIVEHYFNLADSAYNDINSAIVRNIGEENAVAKVCGDVMRAFAGRPHLANDSLLPLIDAMESLELRAHSVFDLENQNVRLLAESVQDILTVLGKYDSDYYFRRPAEAGSGTAFIDSFDLIGFKQVAEIQNSTEENFNDSIGWLLISLIKKMWYVGENRGNPLYKSPHFYRALAALCGLVSWPDLPQYRYEIIQKVKTIQLDLDGNSFKRPPQLTETILLRNGKALKATADVCVLYAGDSTDSSDYDNAYRVIHGANLPDTDRPYIILCTAGTDVDLVLEEVIKKSHLDEFPVTKGVYAFPILYNGIYYDLRLCWSTV